ncbi:MAG: mechanosensitive ion channel [Candidatus Omnitrophica bacterium]|nr:mechanosensitive ion channel [Candidatus Omnitrophota bacterium]
MNVFSGTAAAADAATASGAVAPQAGVQKLVDVVLELMVKYGFQVLGGLVILVLGWFVAKSVAKLIAEFLAKKQMDVTVIKFVASAAKLVVMAFACLAALGKFGIEVTPLIAGLSVVGVGASLALQGTLSNYAAGTSLIFTKPFKVGEIIEVAGVMGEVEDMSLGSTKLTRVDGVRVVVPNKHVIGEIIHNYSGHKGVDIKVGVGYNSDVAQAIETIRHIIQGTAQVDHAKEPKIGISEFADSSITLIARVWCKQRDYLDVLFGINHAILEEFKRRGIEIPFPRRDVHVYARDGGLEK